MNEMRKLMETIQQINEAGYGDEWCDDCGQGRDQCRCDDTGNPPSDWGDDDECPSCGDLTCTDDMCGVEVEEASNDIDPETGDIRTHQRSDEEYMQDVIKLTDEADEALMDEGMNPQEQLNVLAQVMQDISNITRLRASGRPYAPIHEAFGDMDYSGERSVRQSTISLGELMDEGILDPRQVADAALQYMSEADVTDMARMYEWFGDDEDAYESVSEESDDFPAADVAMVGPVEVKHDRGEVSLTHGHGENLFLSQDEWSEFINGLDGYLRG